MSTKAQIEEILEQYHHQALLLKDCTDYGELVCRIPDLFNELVNTEFNLTSIQKKKSTAILLSAIAAQVAILLAIAEDGMITEEGVSD